MGGNWSLTHYWECKWMQPRACKRVWQFLEKLNRELPLDLIHSTARCVFKRSENICSRKNLHMDVPTTLLLTAKTQKHRKCPSVEAQTMWSVRTMEDTGGCGAPSYKGMKL